MIGLNILVFAMLIAGHTEVQVMLINRVHSQRLQRNLLRKLEYLHHLLVFIFPPLLIWTAGFIGPRLLTGGTWNHVSTSWWVCFAICFAGYLGQMWCIIRWQLCKPPPHVKPIGSKIVDVAERLGEKPAGTGRAATIAKLPGNQVMQFELAEKELHLPTLPAEWDRVSFLLLTDWHLFGTPDRRFHETVVAELESLSPDVICFAGDLLDDMDCLEWLPNTLGRLKSRLGKYFILGNHDWLLEPPKIRAAMQDLGWKDLGSQTAVITQNRQSIVIGGNERPWMGQAPDFEAHPEAAFRVLLSHTPDNFYWAQKQNVDLVFAGHNHGGQIVLPIIGPMYTPSRYGVKFSSGCWHQNGTLMYVSRGLAGETPLRYNCRPEVTLLTLVASPDVSTSEDSQQQDSAVSASEGLSG